MGWYCGMVVGWCGGSVVSNRSSVVRWYGCGVVGKWGGKLVVWYGKVLGW